MSRTETVDRLLRSAHQARTEDLGQQVESLDEVRKNLQATLQEAALHQATTVDELARRLLPVAESMARLSETTRSTMHAMTEATAKDRAVMTRMHADQVAAAKATAETLTVALTEAQAALTTTCRTMQAVALQGQRNPWIPALVAACLPLAGVLWLAWKVGALRL